MILSNDIPKNLKQICSWLHRTRRRNRRGREPLSPTGLLGDVVELVELLGPASCNNVSNLGKPEPPRHDTCGVLEPPEGFGGALRVRILSGETQKLSKVIPVIQQRPLRSQQRPLRSSDHFLGIDVAGLRKEIRRALPRGDAKESEDGADYSRIVPPRIRAVAPSTPRGGC